MRKSEHLIKQMTDFTELYQNIIFILVVQRKTLR